MKSRYFLTLLATLCTVSLLLPGCISKKPSSEGTKTEISAGKNQIAFVILTIQNKDEKQASKITKQEIIKTDGKLKENPNTDFSAAPYHLSCELIEKGKVVHSFSIEHPLFKNIEYYDDDGPKTKFVRSEEQEFSIRLQFTEGNSSELKIYETIDTGRRQNIATLKL